MKTKLKSNPLRLFTSGLVALLVMCVVLVGCGSDGSRVSNKVGVTVPIPPSANLPLPPEPFSVVIAAGLVPDVLVFAEAGASAPAQSIPNPRPTGAPAVFVVQERREGWAKVTLPIRPNGSTGWVREADVVLSTHSWRIVVERRLRRMTVFRGSTVTRIETVAIGTGATPTPNGTYFTTELLKPVDPKGPYGSFAYGLNGFTGEANGAGTGAQDSSTEVFGQLGLHGTNDPATLGKEVSLGCIRMADDAIIALVGQLPLGVPVVVTD